MNKENREKLAVIKMSKKTSPSESQLPLARETRSNPNMNQELITNLPSEIIISILSLLPVRTIMSCLLVCKSWLALVKSREFAKAHLSNSVQGLAIHDSGEDLETYKIFEFEDELDLERHELHYNLVIKFKLPFYGWIDSSANGLLFLRDLELDDLHICNPITRDYMKFCYPQVLVYSSLLEATYGFGTSKKTYQHKVVGIFQDCVRDQETQKLRRIPNGKSECHVYTLGTGSWRRIPPGSPLEYGRTTGAFVNGNLHWMVFDLNGRPWISCFDLESECFSSLSSLPLPGNRGFLMGLFALEDCLCLCDNTSDDEIVIWLMKEYGVDNSWTKEFVINKIPDFAYDSKVVIKPINVFKDGDILMAWGNYFLFYYSEKNKSIERIDMFDLGSIGAVLHTPSFLSLKSFRLENVSSF